MPEIVWNVWEDDHDPESNGGPVATCATVEVANGVAEIYRGANPTYDYSVYKIEVVDEVPDIKTSFSVFLALPGAYPVHLKLTPGLLVQVDVVWPGREEQHYRDISTVAVETVPYKDNEYHLLVKGTDRDAVVARWRELFAEYYPGEKQPEEMT